MRGLKSKSVFSLVLLVGLGAGAGPAAAGLPFLKEHVDQERLPKPYGVRVTVYDQRQRYEIDNLAFGFTGISLDPAAVSIDNSITEINLELDLWLFPFLNVFGIFGDLDGQTKVDFSAADLPLPLDRIVVDLNGTVLGGGITLVYGSERWFTSLTAIYTETDLTGDFESSADAIVVMPRVGIHGARSAFWVGAMYQQATESHAGEIDVPFFGTVDFAVDLAEQDQWNFLLGMEASLTEHLHLEIEGGVGSRTTSTFSLSYRF